MSRSARATTRHLLAALGLAAAAFALPAAPAHAQRVGFEAGIAGVENFETVPNLGVSLFVPLTDRFQGAVTYSRWTGCNHQDCSDPRVGYGNQGLNLLGLYRVAGGSALSGSLGGGFGWYEKYRLTDITGLQSERYHQEALTLAGELRRAVSYNSSLYLRGETSFPTDDEQPRWGFLRLGVDVGLF